MSDRALGVLLLGFAGLGPDQDHQQDMYLPAFGSHPGFEVVGVADTPAGASSSTGHRLAAKLGVPAAASWRDGLTDPAVDVVSVCVEPGLRVEAVTAALRAGKHVLVDKPLALTAAECREVGAVAAETGLVCLPAHHQRFHPMIGSALAAVAGGRVGLPWNVQADFLVAGGTPSEAGELANLGVYPIDVVLALTGQRVRQVHARITRHWHDGPADDLALLFLTHDHGVTSTVSVGRMRALADTRPAGLAVHRYRISGSHGVLDVDAARPAVAVRRAEATGATWHGASTVGRLLDVLHAAVTAGRSSSPGPADALHVAEIVDAARASAASGVPVELPDSEEGSR
ncbi:Gfo/Idh/MocA family protein [Jiangella asiatica]|uniref:Gfo/Idh/MocA family oxidoreductase n=1 Tax=Jiangella asiatica TaxID=2530372 RepID=A0A4R5CBK5_9ACTN|nr:Gfo/Idh/MocA family oxidoreductase [Jiangella asiatica]TDD96775.1 Gfo/Idh/MocA family oxidoreductase [Jiangella asiatica]